LDDVKSCNTIKDLLLAFAAQQGTFQISSFYWAG
jgi:hypothetical protein